MKTSCIWHLGGAQEPLAVMGELMVCRWHFDSAPDWATLSLDKVGLNEVNQLCHQRV